MCACVSQSWGPPAGGNLWTVSELLSCATRTASAVLVTGSCASACLVGTKSAILCWPLRSARGLWRCCRTHHCTTAAAREAWRRNCNACRTTGASTWAWLRVSLQHSEGCVNLIRPSAACWFVSSRVLSCELAHSLGERFTCAGVKDALYWLLCRRLLHFAWSAKRGFFIFYFFLRLKANLIFLLKIGFRHCRAPFHF